MKNSIVAICGVLCLSAAFSFAAGRDDARVKAWEERDRAAVLRWFEDNQFGRTPVGRPADETIGERSVSFAGGKIRIDIALVLPAGASKDRPVPVFVFGDHTCASKPPYAPTVYDGIPTNAITARGYAYVTWNFNNVCPNAALYSKDLARWADGVIAWQAMGDPASRDVARPATGWGTIGAWAWGFSRVMDWIETRPELDAKRVAAIGHSRGGKTALWAAAQDTRFAMGISNNSGCGGAKLNNYDCPKSEHIGQILHNFPNWFCPNYAKWIDRDAEIERDSDDLLRLIAPRLCYVASASEDPWAGPPAEKEAWTRAHDVWEAYGCPERMGYHIREGKHRLTPYDWEKYMDFADKYMKQHH